MSDRQPTSRRQFLTRGAQGAALLGAGGAIGYMAGRRNSQPTSTGNAPAKNFQQVASFESGATRPRGIAAAAESTALCAALTSLFATRSTSIFWASNCFFNERSRAARALTWNS